MANSTEPGAVHGVGVLPLDVDVLRVRGEVFAQGRIPEPVYPLPDGGSAVDHRIAEDLHHADLATPLGWSSSPTIHAENIDRGSAAPSR